MTTSEVAGPGGGSFVAVQRYLHDLERFGGLEPGACDAVIGRRRHTNEENPDTVASAHVRRSAQGSFDPPAFMLRRSTPWGSVGEHGPVLRRVRRVARPLRARAPPDGRPRRRRGRRPAVVHPRHPRRLLLLPAARGRPSRPPRRRGRVRARALGCSRRGLCATMCRRRGVHASCARRSDADPRAGDGRQRHRMTLGDRIRRTPGGAGGGRTEAGGHASVGWIRWYERCLPPRVSRAGQGG